MEKAKRYLVFLIGLFINSLGVSLITKADLGTSPISSIPYVLSLNFPLTLGEFTIIFSLLLIFLQLVILQRNFKPEHLLQIPVSIAFGYFIDLCMALLAFVQPQAYPPARQAAARFAAHRKRREDHLTRYVNDVHSGIVNLAMEGLVKLELAQKHEKLHEPRKESMER